MAELQRLLQALNGQKTNILPPNFLKFEPQESNVSSNDSESGYSTFGGDTPTSNKSRSPDTSQLVNGTAVSNGQQHQAGPEGVTIKLEPGVHGGHFRVPHTQNVPSNGAMNVMNGVSNNGHQQQQGPPSVGQQVSNNGQLDTQQSQQQSELDCNAHIAQFMRGQMGGPSPPAPPSGGANNIMSTEDFIAQKKAAIKQEAASPTSCGGGGANATKSPPVSSTIVTSIYECDRSLGVVQQLLADSKQVPSGSKAILVQQVIQTVVEAHLETCNYTEEKVKAGMEKFRVKLESGNMPWAGQRLDAPQFSMGSDSPQDRMSGMQSWMTQAGMPDMSMMDPSKSWSQFVENMVPVITRVVRFSKKLPGFLELDQEDQIKLIKQGSFEVMVARYLPLFQDDGLFVPTMEFKIPREVIMAMPMGAFFEQQFEFARQFRPLNLNDQEMGLLTAVMIMNADRQGLTNRKSVYKLQGLFLQAFYTYIRQNHPENFDDFFMNAINSLPLLRHINETHSRHLNMMKMSSDFKLPKLHEEVFEG